MLSARRGLHQPRVVSFIFLAVMRSVSPRTSRGSNYSPSALRREQNQDRRSWAVRWAEPDSVGGGWGGQRGWRRSPN